jgi:hypothetical protein
MGGSVGIEETSLTLVWDATAIIDMQHGGLLREALVLPFEMVGSDLAISEVHEVSPDELLLFGLSVCSHSGEELLAIEAEGLEYRNLSPTDLASLRLAESLGAVLVTGDASLRRLAESRGVEVHGVLWVFDELVACGAAGAERCAVALRAVLANGGWLPDSECQKRFALWECAVAQE